MINVYLLLDRKIEWLHDAIDVIVDGAEDILSDIYNMNIIVLNVDP